MIARHCLRLPLGLGNEDRRQRRQHSQHHRQPYIYNVRVDQLDSEGGGEEEDGRTDEEVGEGEGED